MWHSVDMTGHEIRVNDGICNIDYIVEVSNIDVAQRRYDWT